jgi:hypothetical protein
MNLFKLLKTKKNKAITPLKKINFRYLDFNEKERLEILSYSVGVLGNRNKINKINKITALHVKEARLYFEQNNPKIKVYAESKIIEIEEFVAFEKIMMQIFNSAKFKRQIIYLYA